MTPLRFNPWHSFLLLTALAVASPSTGRADTCGLPAAASDPTPEKAKPGAAPVSYVRVEVKGTLVRKNDGYYVRATDAVFPSTEVLVKLERSEDKDRSLDDHLQALEGKVVVAEGYLDCRSVGGEKASIEIHLSNEKQVRAAGDE